MTEAVSNLIAHQEGRLAALSQLVIEIMARLPPRDSRAVFEAASDLYCYTPREKGFTGDMAARHEGVTATFDEVRSRLEHEGIIARP